MKTDPQHIFGLNNFLKIISRFFEIFVIFCNKLIIFCTVMFQTSLKVFRICFKKIPTFGKKKIYKGHQNLAKKYFHNFLETPESDSQALIQTALRIFCLCIVLL